MKILLLRNVPEAVVGGCAARDSIIGHLAFVGCGMDDRPLQGLQHHLPRRLRHMIPKLLEFRGQRLRTRVLAARGGAVEVIANIDFFLEIEVVAQTSRPRPSKPTGQE